MLLHVRFNLHNYVMLRWLGWGGGGWVGGGMLTFIGLAHLRDATLLHVRFNLHNYVMLCYCTFASIYTTTWCYVDWGGWVGGMLTFIGLAHLRDATLLHVLFNLYNYVMLRYCTFSSIYTTTWCYATARSLQFTQLRDATLTGGGGVGGWVGGMLTSLDLHTYVMLRYCTFSSIYTTTWCYATARSLQFTQLRDAMLLHVRFNLHDWGGGVGGWVGGDVNVHWTCTLTWCYATARSLQFTQLRDARLTGVGGWGGGWAGMLTFIGLAHLRDATLLHVLFNLYNYVMLRYCTFSSIYTTRDAMLLHVRFNLHNYVMLRWLGWGGGWVGGMLTFIGLAHLRDATLLHVLWRNLFFSNLHRKVKTLVGSEINPSLRRRCFQYVWRCNLQTCTPLVMLKELAKLVKNNDADNC